MHVIKDWK